MPIFRCGPARSLPWLLLCCAVLFAPRLVCAQGIITGAIAGTILDPNGAVVPGADVTAVEQSTGAQQDTRTLGNGDFSFPSAPIGIYSIAIGAQGFLPIHVNGVRVVAGVVSEVGEKKLGLGGVQASVSVQQNNTVQLDTTESQVSTAFSSVQLQNLPLANGFDSITLLVPGVARTLNDTYSNTNGAGISVNGQRGRSNNFEIDGQSNNDNSIGGPMIYFDNQDALAEIQVITDNFSAEYGRNMGSVVNYITKSGTNRFHGTGFEFYTGSWLSSLDNQQKSPLFGFCLPGQSPASTGCIPPTLPRLVDNRFGGTIGGPIQKNKLWFFGSVYWERAFTGTQPSGSQGAVTPTLTGLQQLAAAFPGNPAVGVLQSAGPFGVTVGNPVAIAGTTTTETVTTPNGPAQIQVAQFQRSIPTPYTDQEHLGRIDWQPTVNDRFYLRYFYQYDQTAGSAAPSIAQGQYVNIVNPNHSVGADWTHTFSPHWTDQLRYSFQQSKVDFQGGSEPACTTTNLTACTAQVYFYASNDSGFGMSANDPQGRTIKVTQVQNNAHWTHGNHNVAFGGEWDYQNSPNVFLPTYNGVLLYSGLNAMLHDATGTGLVDMANGSAVIPFTENDAALYAQDDWRIRPDLTLNLGLRWEYFGQAVNELHALSLARQTGPNPFWSTTLPLSTTTVPVVPRNWKDYEPRVGFSWNPTFAQKFVVRGGFSIDYDPAFYNMFLIAAIYSPVIDQNTFGCGGGACLPANGSLTGAAVRAADLQYLSTGGNPALANESYFSGKFLNPYTQTYALGVEYQLTPNALVSIRYVGNHTVHNFQSIDANPDLQAVAAQFPNVVAPSSLCSDPTQPGYGRLNCARGNLNEVTNGAFSLYNGLQTSIVTRNLHGLTANFAYTYSRTIDNVSEVFSNGAGGTTLAYAQNPLNTDRAERNVSGNSYPNVVALGLTYVLPFYAHQSNWKNRLFGGYVYDMVYTYNTGQPYNAYQPLGFTNPVTGASEGSFCDGAFNQAFLHVDTCRLVLSNPHAPLNTVAYNAGPGNGYVVYNPSSTGPAVPTSPAAAHWIVDNTNEAITLGNPYPGSGRNILRGQSFDEVDATLSKEVPLVRTLALQLQVSAYNLFNHDYLGTPYAGLSADNPSAPVNPFLSNKYNNSYGNALVNTGGLPGNRVVQLGTRILF